MPDLAPAECLLNLQDSILNADMQYDDEDRPVRFATERQTRAISIAVQKIIPRIKRDDRIATLATVAGRNPRLFKSTQDLTLAGACALLSALYGDAAEKLSTAPMQDDAVSAIKHAYSLSVKELVNAPTQREM